MTFKLPKIEKKNIISVRSLESLAIKQDGWRAGWQIGNRQAGGMQRVRHEKIGG